MQVRLVLAVLPVGATLFFIVALKPLVRIRANISWAVRTVTNHPQPSTAQLETGPKSDREDVPTTIMLEKGSVVQLWQYIGWGGGSICLRMRLHLAVVHVSREHTVRGGLNRAVASISVSAPSARST